MDKGDNTNFETHVLPSEHASINRRREILGRAPIMKISDPSATEQVSPIYDTLGLALSGGGIRATAISLGVLQAFNKAGVLDKIDYLSSVSGGGYIGTSLAATMTATHGRFVFVDEVTSPLAPSPAVAHLRNHSNYLLAGGRRGVASAFAIIVRGLVANVAIVVPFLLFLSAFVISLKPNSNSLHTNLSGITLRESFDAYFSITFTLLLLGLILFLLWALYLSFLPARNLSDESSKLPAIGALYLVAISLVFFAELQPLVLAGMFNSANRRGGPGVEIAEWIHAVALVGLPVGIMVALFQRRLGAFLERSNASSNPFLLLAAVGGRIAVLLTAVELGLLLWVTFLSLTFWGIKDSNLEYVKPSGSWYHAPSWISDSAQALFGHAPMASWYFTPMALLYLTVGGLLLFVAGLLKPNTLTLLGLYRDRLRRAFLFDPTATSDKGDNPLSTMHVSDISSEYAPFYLINAALNIRGSSYANQRGRNADFFSFSPSFAGSLVTGYVPMKEFEKAEPGFDLATAMAISGAAVSSSMGANTIRLLAPTLALLNIRLGYWVRNPKNLHRPKHFDRKVARSVLRSTSSLWSEITGQLYTDISDEVYLTDGGHIENLGVYELLRRRCGLIICVDAEADPQMRFSSFMTLQRYASIDLGVQIIMPWEKLQKTTVQWMGYDPLASRSSILATSGPHAAIGIIRYPAGKTGSILYLKSSLTGDEPDYVRDYARRYPSFPHEPTGKQFFNEEQFEVYRALGFHMTEGVLSGKDAIGIEGSSGLFDFLLSKAKIPGPVPLDRDG